MCTDLKELFGIKDIADDVKAVTKELRNSLRNDDGAVHTFTVQKPYCCPAAPLIRRALETYGVKIINLGADSNVMLDPRDFLTQAKMRSPNEPWATGLIGTAMLPLAVQCKVTVRKSQAEWAEYLLERTKRLYVIGGRINSKNRDWADRHNGKMPRPWIEKSCSEGNGIWSQVAGIQKAQESEANGE